MYAVCRISLLVRYWFSVCSVSRCFGRVYTNLGGVIGDLEWYVAVRRAWSDCLVFSVDTCVILCGVF